MPGPQVCVGGCLRVVARGMAVGARFRGASGTPPPTVFPGKGGDGSLPLIRPCGATFPQGGRQGLLLAAAGVSAGGNQGKDGNASLRGASGTPPPTGCPGTGGSGRSRRGEGTPPYGWGYGNAVGFTRAAVPGAPRGRGRACPARGLAWAGVPVLPPHPAHISTGV